MTLGSAADSQPPQSQPYHLCHLQSSCMLVCWLSKTSQLRQRRLRSLSANERCSQLNSLIVFVLSQRLHFSLPSEITVSTAIATKPIVGARQPPPRPYIVENFSQWCDEPNGHQRPVNWAVVADWLRGRRTMDPSSPSISNSSPSASSSNPPASNGGVDVDVISLEEETTNSLDAAEAAPYMVSSVSTPNGFVSSAASTSSTLSSVSHSATPTVTDGNNAAANAANEKRYLCQRCLNHQLSYPRKGHKPHCRYATCSCEQCRMVEQRRQLNNQLSRRRLDPTAPKPTPGVKKIRDPKCARCSAHGKDQALRGHKRALCPYGSCDCNLCGLVENRRSLMAKQIKLRRDQQKARKAQEAVVESENEIRRSIDPELLVLPAAPSPSQSTPQRRQKAKPTAAKPRNRVAISRGESDAENRRPSLGALAGLGAAPSFNPQDTMAMFVAARKEAAMGTPPTPAMPPTPLVAPLPMHPGELFEQMQRSQQCPPMSELQMQLFAAAAASNFPAAHLHQQWQLALHNAASPLQSIQTMPSISQPLVSSPTAIGIPHSIPTLNSSATTSPTSGIPSMDSNAQQANLFVKLLAQLYAGGSMPPIPPAPVTSAASLLNPMTPVSSTLPFSGASNFAAANGSNEFFFSQNPLMPSVSEAAEASPLFSMQPPPSLVPSLSSLNKGMEVDENGGEAMVSVPAKLLQRLIFHAERNEQK